MAFTKEAYLDQVKAYKGRTNLTPFWETLYISLYDVNSGLCSGRHLQRGKIFQKTHKR